MTTPIERKIESLKSTWYVWLFPFFAILIAGWLFLKYQDQNGPEIRILFGDASGLEAGKTRVRYRGVDIGKVQHISISTDNKDVVATVSLQKDATQFAVEGSKFWAVIPQVGFQGVRGLETLFEGTYIAVDPGPPDSDFKNSFKGTIGSETSESIEDTSSYSLETNNLESVSVGDSITFRGLKIGNVTRVNLSKTAQTVLVQINIQNRYVKLIRTNTVFWRKVGVQANLGLFSSEVKINSLEALMRGGIDLFTPTAAGPQAKHLAKFTLLAKPPEGWEKWNPVLE